MKRLALALLLLLSVALGAMHLFREGRVPPGDDMLIRNFHDKELTYERLRDRMLSEGKVDLVADWGVSMPDFAQTLHPPIADMSLARYDDYLALLKEIDGLVVSRSKRDSPGVCILVWAAGFAGETQHEAVCWLTQTPAGQVARLDEIHKMSAAGKRTTVYRHIDSHWYLERDE